MIQFYEIQHKETGHYIPMYRSGGTWVEPKETDKPQLFRSRTAAVNFLNEWCKGRACNAWKSSPFPGDLGAYEISYRKYELVPSRRRSDMQIVEFSLYFTRAFPC